jgi:acetyl-CoA acyltransferase
MKDAVIVSAVRTAVGKAPGGSLRATRPDDMAAVVIDAALSRSPRVDRAEIDDVILGCAMPEAEQGLNVARIASLRAGLPVSASAVTVNRFCASGLQAIAFAAERILAGSAKAIVAGGTESMSLVPMGGHKPAPNPVLVETYPDTYLTTGLVAENHARDYAISREEQDAFALRSQLRAAAAIREGRFDGEIVPVSIPQRRGDPISVDTDEHPRPDTTLDKLAALKPAFRKNGTVTAGNSSGVNDGAAATLVMAREKAEALGYKPLGKIVATAVAGVDPSCMGIGPVPATKKALERAGMTVDDLDLIELNEAFAAQSIACVRDLSLDEDKVNVNGGAIALGHPLGCSGARIMTTLLHEMARRDAEVGLATMCIGVGQGIATIVQRV